MKQKFLHCESWGYEKNPAKMLSKAHLHTYNEIYYLISGTRRYTVENEIYDLVPGDVVIIPSMTLHSTLSIPGTQNETTHERFLQTVYDGELPTELEECFKTHFYRPDGKDAGILRQIAEESRRELASPKENSELLLYANLVKMMVILSRCRKVSFDSSVLSGRDRIMQNAAYYIKENSDRPLTLENVAKQFFYSREYFSTVFKSSIGMSFIEYLNSVRISKALQLLDETPMKITEISERCGFDDSNYFATVFRKNVGMSPTEYRKK